MTNVRAPIEYVTVVKSYEEARLYCMFLDVDGQRNWRLPSSNEAYSIRFAILGGVIKMPESIKGVVSTSSRQVWCEGDDARERLVYSYVWPVRDLNDGEVIVVEDD